MPAKSLIALLAIAAVAAIAPSAALACSCAGPTKGKERAFYRGLLKRSDGAIIAKLVRVRSVRRGGKPVPFAGQAVYVYRVRKVFKKRRRFPRGRIVRVRSPRSSASCGIDQRVGTRGGLFLYRERGRWRSNLCLRVSPRDLRRAARGRGSRAAAAGSGCAAPAS